MSVCEGDGFGVSVVRLTRRGYLGSGDMLWLQ